MPYTQQTQMTCHICGYPNRLAANGTVRRKLPRRGAQIPFNKIQKTSNAAQDQKPKHVKELQSKKPETCNEFWHIASPEVCAVLLLE